MNPGDDASFQALTQQISDVEGLALQSYKEKCLRRRIAVRMRARGVHTYQDYQSMLREYPEEYPKLRDSLTINVTKFFRNAATWESLADKVLPELFQEREGRVRVWSAGCASGEEPYTVAMVLADLARRLARPTWLDRVTIDATDIDRRCLVQAEAARYRSTAFEEAPDHFREEYCRPVDDGYEVVPSLRSLVRVRHVDLMRDPPLVAEYDLVVCRNVVIYFDRPTQETLYHKFADVLPEEKGVLVLGKVETLFGPVQKRFKLLDVRERIYRRCA
jgi:chemotaxis methyl-accepting protein methylase